MNTGEEETLQQKKKVLRIPVMEVFGPTIQGEGRVVGQKTIFVRTGGCDYKCSWCDSKFTWDGSEKATMMTPDELLEKVLDISTAYIPLYKNSPPLVNEVPITYGSYKNANHITLTGGNPALIGEAMESFIQLAKLHGFTFSVETQGTKYQSWFHEVEDVCLSPKPPSSGMTTDFYKLDHIIQQCKQAYNDSCGDIPLPYLKVVIFDDADFVFAKEVHKRYPDLDFFVSVGNADVTSDGNIVQGLLNKYDWLVEKVLADPDMNNVKPLPQLHTLLWGNKRGV